MRIGKQDEPFTSICTSDADSITVRGLDLCEDIIGKIDFTSYFWMLVTGTLPTPKQLFFCNAVLAAIAGVLSLTSGRLGGLAGVFISVTTVPAAGNVALGLAFWLPDEILGSAAQLGLNLAAMMIAGWCTLRVQQSLGKRLPANPFQHDLVQRRRKDQLQQP